MHDKQTDKRGRVGAWWVVVGANVRWCRWGRLRLTDSRRQPGGLERWLATARHPLPASNHDFGKSWHAHAEPHEPCITDGALPKHAAPIPFSITVHHCIIVHTSPSAAEQGTRPFQAPKTVNMIQLKVIHSPYPHPSSTKNIISSNPTHRLWST